ncbi:Queuine tRNA-ribosyltransferase subunit qtrtd1 [Podila epigama]|nr:Queuine tRNA-ribosyltransferase subunit qtrtd1 [Podila epigama]
MLTFSLHANTAFRRGKLSLPTRGDNKEATGKRVIETPGCLMYTNKGSVPHLTPDNLRLQDYGGVNVSMEHLLQNHHLAGLDKWPFDLATFLHLQEFILLCQLRDTSSFMKLAPTTDRYVTLTTFQGIRQLTLKDYVDIIRVYRPDIVVAFSDNIVETFRDPSTVLPGKKRVQKSVDRSLTWLDQVLLERQGLDGFAQEAAKNPKKVETRKEQRKKERFQKLAELHHQKQQQEVDGTLGIKSSSSLASSPQSTLTAEETSVSSSNTTTTTAEHKTEDHGNETDTGLAHATPKPWTETAVFAQLHGSDLISERVRSAEESAKRDVQGFVMDVGSLVASKTMTKNAVLNCVKVSTDPLPADKPRLLYGIRTPEDVLRAIPMGVDLFDTTYPFQLTEDGKASLYYFKEPTIAGVHTTTLTTSEKRWINLWDEEHGDKFEPILDGCECYACKDGRHTRAYINHLLKTHEMLATVLLMSHNMHQYSKFFASVRKSIEDGTFEKESAFFHERFGEEPERTGEKHEAQVMVEASLSRRANRLEGAEEGEVDAIGSSTETTTTAMKKRPNEDINDSSSDNKKSKPE